MPSPYTKEEYIARVAPAFEGFPWVVAAYLFGSHARGWVRPWSDVDVGLVLSPEAPEGDDRILALAKIETRIARALDGLPIDLVVLNHQGPVFQHSVLRTGFLLHETDRTARVLWEARVISEYCDWLPTLKWFQRFHEAGVRWRLRRI